MLARVKSLLLLFFLGLFCWTGCSEPEAVSPSTGAETQDVKKGVARPAEADTAQVEEPGGNLHPEVLSVSYDPPYFYHGVNLRAVPQSVDPEEDEVNYHYLWIVNGEEMAWENDAVLAGDRFHRGDKIAIEVTPYDYWFKGQPYRTGEIVVPNGPPAIVSDPPGGQGFDYTYQVLAEDPDGDTLSFFLDNAPPGMVIDEHSGLIRWKITESAVGKFVIKVSVQDEYGLKAEQVYDMNLAFEEQVEN